jgi:signal transduction histidine kinase
MRSARNLWFGYLGAGLVVVIVVGVISGVALYLETETERTRQREEQLDRVRIALWRLDSHMTPVLGRVAGHSYSHFVPAYSPARLYDAQGRRERSKLLLAPSPILMNDWPDWLVLHFQAPTTGRITSPQVPQGWYRWVASVPGVRIARGGLARPEQVQRLERLLSPAVRRRLIRAVIPAAGSLGSPPIAVALATTARHRRDSYHGRAPSQQVPEQKSRQSNLFNIQKLFTPRSNAENLDNALLNTNTIGPTKVDNENNVTKVLVDLSPVRSAWISGAVGANGARRLILYRVAQVRGRFFLQGALLDWKRLRTELAGLVRDLFHRVRLRPTLGDFGAVSEHAMTTLPVALALPAKISAYPWYRWTPVRGALGVAWVLTVLALGATALVIRRMVDLGERRMSFASAVSHELRTPLTAFRIHLDLLADGLVSDEVKRQEMLEKLRGQSDRLAELVRNVLDFARLERRTFVADLQRVTVDDLLEDLRATTVERVEAAGLTLDLEVDSGLASGGELRTDLTAVRQIISNLVDNACKYGGDGDDPRIHIRARGDGGAVVIEVADHGPGIPAKARRRLFDPFYRAGREMTREKPGVGLGLALAKRFADTLGARLSLEGRPRSDGTVAAVFALRLPRG